LKDDGELNGPPCKSSAGRNSSVDEDFIHIAPEPVLAGFEGLDDWVLGFLEVLSGVFAGGGIAAADVAAGEANAQMNPLAAGFQTFLAALAAGLYFLNLVQMGTGLFHD
jgi:hypothetical protein